MQLRPPRRFLTATLLVLCVLALTGFGCRQQSGTGERPGGSLIVWGLWQESAQMKPVLDAFEAQYGVKVEYKKIASVASYEKDLLEAFAEGRGPDVFVLHHTWVEGKRGLLAPAPTSIIDERALRQEFVDVVASDVLRNNLVYALPTSVDTMALFYNKDILNAAGVAAPPATWTQVQQVAKRVTKVNRVGALEQSAVALGTAHNVNRAADILQLLLLQSGLKISDAGRVKIAQDTGEDALIFYTDFANKAKEVYTWDLGQDFSLDAFAEGDTAMMFNYSYHVPTVRAKNPGLNFAVAPMPQIAGSSEQNFANFAAYWPFGVSISSTAPKTAWQFLRFMTSKEPAALINKAQGVPPARRDSLADFAADPVLGVFGDQVLTARSWPRPDILASDAIFTTMIDSIIRGEATSYKEALQRAEDQLNLLGKKDE